MRSTKTTKKINKYRININDRAFLLPLFGEHRTHTHAQTRLRYWMTFVLANRWTDGRIHILVISFLLSRWVRKRNINNQIRIVCCFFVCFHFGFDGAHSAHIHTPRRDGRRSAERFALFIKCWHSQWKYLLFTNHRCREDGNYTTYIVYMRHNSFGNMSGGRAVSRLLAPPMKWESWRSRFWQTLPFMH